MVDIEANLEQVGQAEPGENKPPEKKKREKKVYRNIKVVQWGVRLQAHQVDYFRSMMTQLRGVWNEALRYLMDLETFTAYCKADKTRYAVCPLPYRYRYIRWDGDPEQLPPNAIMLKVRDKKTKVDVPATTNASGNDDNDDELEDEVEAEQNENKSQLVPFIPVPYSSYARTKPYAPFCPLQRNGLNHVNWDNVPSGTLPDGFLKVTNDGTYLDRQLFQLFTHKNCPHLKDIPANFIRGLLRQLATAWKQRWDRRNKYGEPGYPRFKSLRNPVETLCYLDASKLRRVEDTIYLPKVGAIRAKGITKRFAEGVPILELTITENAEGWFMGWAGDLPLEPVKVHEPPRCVTVLLGDYKTHHRTSEIKPGTVASPDDPYPRVTPSFIPSDKDLNRLVRLQQVLSRKQTYSKSWHRVKAKIARLHYRIKMQRQAFNHKLSTYLVRRCDHMVIDACKTKALRRPAPVPIGTEPPRWAKNGASVVSEINKIRTINAKSSFREMVIKKAQVAGKTCVVQPVTNAYRKKRKSDGSSE